MSHNGNNGSVKVSWTMLRIIGVILSLAAVYFLTIQSLKVEMAAKAESVAVETLDKKLANIEVMLKEGVVSKEQFYQFSKDTESRLSRIEFYLKEKLGDKVGKN
ncbi:MAG: hypothetical protein JSV52_07730 [Candidatus Zixiibacteriota bacterium]|nr:MAG: hypothetical protein JSV52_07730 [candidate division Zixibacteria bacterium]